MKLPYRYRGILLLTLLVVALPGAAWHFALHDTFDAWRDCRQLKAQLAATAPALSTSASESVPAQSPEMILSGQLLDVVRQAATNLPVRVVGYEPVVTLQQDGLAIHTAQLTLTGGYTALLRVVAELERALPGCRMRSLEWQRRTDIRAHRTQLVLTLYMQQIV